MSYLAPSMLSADFLNFGEQLKKLKEAGIRYLHVDVMDGVFVPSISFGQPVVKSVRRGTDLFFDVHMMVTEPARYIEDFAKAGADGITIHFEACKDVEAAIEAVRKSGCKAGISIKPATEPSEIYKYLSLVDMVLVMSVEPGFGGQKFMPDSLRKIKALKKYIVENDLNCIIEIDGGICAENIKEVSEAGTDLIVAGTAVFNGDIISNINRLKEAMEGAGK